LVNASTQVLIGRLSPSDVPPRRHCVTASAQLGRLKLQLDVVLKLRFSIAVGLLRTRLKHPLIYANPKVWVKTLFDLGVHRI
jgi:hypothetical protein